MLTEKEQKELERLLKKQGCPTCGQQIEGRHFCPGPKRKEIVYKK